MADDLEAGTEGEALASPTLRRCIVTRQALEKPAMIRFVIDPEGRVTPDLKERLPGRGLWVTASRDALDQAAAKNAFSKAAKQSVKVDRDLADRVVALAKRELAELLGLARKSGQLVAGFEKVDAALRAGKVRVLVAASDGGRTRKTGADRRFWSRDMRTPDGGGAGPGLGPRACRPCRH
jgi:predicted RNA-binding protein YlxR (DUF448 family)